MPETEKELWKRKHKTTHLNYRTYKVWSELKTWVRMNHETLPEKNHTSKVPFFPIAIKHTVVDNVIPRIGSKKIKNKNKKRNFADVSETNPTKVEAHL